MLNVTKVGLSLLLMANGCASTIRYSNFPDSPSCDIPFKVVDAGKPNFVELSSECLGESTLNGRVREAVLEFNNKLYRLIVDPEFPSNDFDRRSAQNLVEKISKVQPKNNFLMNCDEYRRITTYPINNDGIYFSEIN